MADQPWGDERPSARLRAVFPGALIVSEGYTRDTAEEALLEGRADLVAFGRAFTANADLVSKLRDGTRLELDDPKTFLLGRTGRLHRLMAAGFAFPLSDFAGPVLSKG